jgi:hypothetical protein
MSYRAENNGTVLIAENVDLTNSGLHLYPAIPPHVSFACISALIVTNNFTAGSTATISIGTPGSSYSDLTGSAVLGTFTAVNQSQQVQIVALAPTISSGTQIGISITPQGSPPGPFSAQITLVGYYF